jgi:hypothetical protein
MTGIIYLNYKRKEHSERALQSVLDGKADYELLEVEMFGIAAAINYGLKHFFEDKGLQNVAICANDIVMPCGWLSKMIEDAKAIPETGMSAIHCVEGLPDEQTINGIKVHPAWGVFGCGLLTKAAFDKVGYFNTDHDPYGMQDSDYCYRLTKAGFLNYYTSMLKAEHIGGDVGTGTDYRKMKDEGLSKAGNIFGKWQKVYDEGQVYLPYLQENYIIEMNQMYGAG